MSVKVGIIGLGNMGGTLAERMLTSGVINAEDMLVANRSQAKIAALKAVYPQVQVALGNQDLAARSDMIFLCVKTPQAPDVLFDIRSSLGPKKHVILTNGGVQLKHAAALFDGPVSKLIPSMTMSSGKGISLLCHHERVGCEDRSKLEEMAGRLCNVRIVDEGQFEVAADLTSCAPAFVAEFAKKFAEAGSRHGDLDETESRQMVLSMLLGTSIMLAEGKVSIEDMKTKVATKGGITEQGLKVMDEMLPDMFDRMFSATLAKHEQVKTDIAARFESAR